MRKVLAAVGALMVILGIVSLTFPPGEESVHCPLSLNVSAHWAEIKTVKNGAGVRADVLAVHLNINESEVIVINEPSGEKYVFTRRNGLYYPPRPVFVRLIRVEGIPLGDEIKVYASSRNYSFFLTAEEDYFTVGSSAPNFGGLGFPCDRDGFLLNLTEPRGSIYVDGDLQVMALSNESITINGKSLPRKPLSLIIVCENGRAGYTLETANPFGGFESRSGSLGGFSILTLPPGFKFEKMIAYPNYTAYRILEALKKGENVCPGEAGKPSSLGAVLLVGGALLLGLAFER